jgi:hypothetical protein
MKPFTQESKGAFTGLCPPCSAHGLEDIGPKTIQVGGDHYKGKIQPIEFIQANGLSFCQGNAIKYIFRYKDKNGIEDLEKAKHYIDFMIEELTVND